MRTHSSHRLLTRIIPVVVSLALVLTLSAQAGAAMFLQRGSGGAERSHSTRHHRRHRHHRRDRLHRDVASHPGSDAVAGDSFYVDPSNPAALEQQSLISQGDRKTARKLSPIADQPSALWLSDEASAQSSFLPETLSAAGQAGQVPVLVTYDIPDRDCGGFSSGGASDAAAYRSYVDTITNRIGNDKVLIIVEPDAIAELGCLSSGGKATRISLLRYAVRQFDTDPNAAVYVDAGNPGWPSPSYAAKYLNKVLSGLRGGFSVNVSNFYSTPDDVTFGTAISGLTGGRHFVIDTSRNGGHVRPGRWCNPAGASLGSAPTTNTGNSLVDADLWVKPPGTSDGPCNGGPTGGQFFLSYALALIHGKTS